ncbi:flagellar assembly protein FliH [Glaciecola petra]|uniref:Flagellar assembly protein FliH n=1 Tax=Glaciecola petra TaxID=3075602 RepID=A0ABU2ZN17_9ALTE|nr:flagellar assembly protein FliH [Aestuariibacter sp. P117]MDT0593811.1 flagellar assembly protein FliH [Aestuariibacter sp. P117]
MFNNTAVNRAGSATQKLDKAKKWDLPSVEDEQLNHEDDKSGSPAATDALNRPRGKWKYEAPEVDEDLAPLTAAEIEEIRQAAHSEGLKTGHAEGFEQGKQEGFEEGQKEGVESGKKAGFEEGIELSTQTIEAKKNELSGYINDLHQPLKQIDEDVQKELVILAINMAKAVVNVEITQNEKVLLNAVNRAIQALPSQEKDYSIIINPEDYPVFLSHFDETIIKQNNWRINTNDTIARGGCKIQTNDHAVDLSIEKRCSDIFSQMLIKQGLSDDPRAS